MNTQFPQPHTGSYYAATANSNTDYPVLEGAVDCDVCVIGGGFTGISSALELSERGYKVAVVEANRVSWGASGRNGGQLIGGISGEARMHKAQGKDMSDIFWEMHWAGNDIVKKRGGKIQDQLRSEIRLHRCRHKTATHERAGGILRRAAEKTVSF